MMHAGRCKTGESFFLLVIPGLHHFFEAVAEIKNMFYKNMAIFLKFSKGLKNRGGQKLNEIQILTS